MSVSAIVGKIICITISRDLTQKGTSNNQAVLCPKVETGRKLISSLSMKGRQACINLSTTISRPIITTVMTLVRMIGPRSIREKITDPRRATPTNRINISNKPTLGLFESSSICAGK
ncbi:unannotated protein [freshwater metagenome]|uniref:Unannotated protein n=1 Tax=freshwater metagenome TaxID=449393 RepID=A0A6J6F3M3_9ZZZZ